MRRRLLSAVHLSEEVFGALEAAGAPLRLADAEPQLASAVVALPRAGRGLLETVALQASVPPSLAVRLDTSSPGAPTGVEEARQRLQKLLGQKASSMS